jgi:hypothetical protein
MSLPSTEKMKATRNNKLPTLAMLPAAQGRTILPVFICHLSWFLRALQLFPVSAGT